MDGMGLCVMEEGERKIISLSTLERSRKLRSDCWLRCRDRRGWTRLKGRGGVSLNKLGLDRLCVYVLMYEEETRRDERAGEDVCLSVCP